MPEDRPRSAGGRPTEGRVKVGAAGAAGAAAGGAAAPLVTPPPPSRFSIPSSPNEEPFPREAIKSSGSLVPVGPSTERGSSVSAVTPFAIKPAPAPRAAAKNGRAPGREKG